VDTYNMRAQKAIDSISLSAQSFLLFDRGRNDTEKSVVKVVNGKLIGYGFFDSASIDGNIALLDDILTACPDNRDAQVIIHSFLAKAKPGNVIYLSGDRAEF